MSRAQKLGQIFLSATLAAATSPLVAQDTPVVFQHGILSGPNTWLMIGDTIARYLRVLPVAKQTDWWKTEATQASQLFNALNADPNTSSSSQRIPFVAHSNGGLVSRRLSIDDPRVANLVTVASPHRGAHIGNTFRNGQVLNYMTYFGDRLNAPLVFYANNDPAWQNVPYLITAINGWNSLWNWLSTNLNAELCPIVGYCVTIEDGFAAVVPMVVDVSEGSNLINQLNDPGNLSREQNALANRIYFYTSITADNGLLHFLFPDDWTSLASMRENDRGVLARNGLLRRAQRSISRVTVVHVVRRSYRTPDARRKLVLAHWHSR
jgi:pimeloyl-ACP methyl ester carboxylesterase